MKANVRSIRKQRRYTEDFKRSLVEDFESGKFSVPQLEKIHGVSNGTIYQWIYKFSTFNGKGYRVVEKNESSQHKLSELEHRIKELESMLGRKQIQIDYLEKMIDLAQDEYSIAIKKNSDTPQSDTSENTKTS